MNNQTPDKHRYFITPARELPEDARRFTAVDERGLGFHAAELPCGKRVDVDAWRFHSDSEIPSTYIERGD